MSVPVSFCPPAPALHPDLASVATAAFGEVREAAFASVELLVGADPRRIVVLGGRGDPGRADGGSLAGFGVAVAAGGPRPGLGPEHTLGAWLLDRAGWTGRRRYHGGAVELADDDALLVMADGSACRAPNAPGSYDDRAEGFDRTIVDALTAGDAAALASIDLDLAAEVLAAGAPAVRWAGRAVATQADRGGIETRVLYDRAPFGVGTWVAHWAPAG